MKNYTNYEFENLTQYISDLYRSKEGLSDTYDSSMGQTLIQLLVDVTDNLMYKLERRSQENYISTARLETSIRAGVSDVGYRPRRKVSSTGTLRLSLIDEDANPIFSEGNIHIAYGTPVYFDDVEFIVNDDYVIPKGHSYIDIQVKQGTLVTETYNFEDEPYKTTNYIEYTDVVSKEEYSIKITGDKHTYKDVLSGVNGLRIRSVSFADKTMPVYDIKYTRSGMRIVFGDGIFGLKPTGNINVSWVESDGGGVNIVKTGLEFNMDSPVLYDDVQVTPLNTYEYSLVNITPIRGGVDEEDIEEMRNNVVSFVRSNDRAVTNFDYEFWGMRSGIGNIVDMKAYGEHETNQLIFTMNNVYITYATPDRLELNQSQIQELRSYLNVVKTNTTHMVFRPVDPIYLGLTVDFKRHPDLPISDAQLYRVLVERINSYFEIKKGSIGKEFQHSEFVEYLQNLIMRFNNIDYLMTDFVKVKAVGMKDFDIPQPIYDGIIELDDTYVVTPNDVWTVIIDNTPYSVVAVSTDTITTLVDKMQALIFKGTSLMLARPAHNQIRIKHPKDQGFYNITVGTGQVGTFTRFKQLIKIPRPTNVTNPNENQLLPGSVEIVDKNGNVIMSDDSNGLLINDDAGYPAIVIDYTNCQFEYPSIPEDTYYVRFQQNEYQNFAVTRESLVDVMPFRSESDNEDMHFFSTLNLLR